MERGFGGEQVAVGFLKSNRADLLVADEHPLEDGLVEAAADFVGGFEVELVGVLKQGQVRFDVPRASGEVEFDTAELLADAFAFGFDRAEPVLDLDVGDVGVAEQVEQVLFLRVEGRELVFELAAQESLGVVLVGDGVDHERAHGFEELGVVVLGLVEVLDGVLDAPDVVEGLAAAIAPVGAEEVEVLAAVAALGALQDEALLDAALVPAFTAEHGALEVVVMFPAPLRRVAAGADDALHPVEQFLLDERFVPAGVLLTLVADVAEVVAVAQHLMDLVHRHRPGGPFRGGPGGEAAGGEFFDEVADAVFAGGVQLERELHERCSLRVGDDGADLASFAGVHDVEVAQRGAADASAALDFLAHLVGDVGSGCFGLVLVDDGEHALHQLTGGGFVDPFGGGDEGDTHLLQRDPDQGVVVSVPGHAGHHVHDDVVHIALSLDTGEHLPERGPLAHLGGGLAGLDVLVDDRDAELVGFALAGHPLGGDGLPVGVVAGAGLLFAGHPQIDDGAGARRHLVERQGLAEDAAQAELLELV
ncbi:MAG TPA: hypothetical protein VL294_11555 [Pseudolysinimonas sp.]|nr:hypothetical protein [Pseudolysinimonas sp.]